MFHKSRSFVSIAVTLTAVFLAVLLVALVQSAAAVPAAEITGRLNPAQIDASSSPNVILIVVDTLRADHVSSYGYTRTTTANLDTRIADQGVVLEDVATTSPWTCPANAAMVTGRGPTAVGSSWMNIGTTLPPDETTLAELLHDAGYYTAGFISSVYCVKGSIGFDQGFDVYDDSFAGRPSSNKARAEEVNELAFDWLENTWSGTQPLFLYLYYFDPHTWYDPLPPYDTLYDPDYTGPITPAVFADGEAAIRGELIIDDRDLRHLLALYDGEITYWDNHLGQMLDTLDNFNLLDNSLIVVTTDHGEMFREHGKWSHAGSLYEEVLRIPMIMRYPGVIPAGLRIDSPVQNMDLMPTILDYAGIPLPDNLEAVNLRPLIEGQPPTTPRSIYAQVNAIDDPDNLLYWFFPRHHLRSIRQDEWKLIHSVGLVDGNELYMLQPNSLYEVENLVEQEPQRAAQMQSDLYDWFFRHQVFLPAEMK